jgi:putative membrane-bound dehydrogenase-like protein
VITVSTPGHATEVDVDITGAKELYLVVTDGGDSYAADWADWAFPRLIGPKGEKKLTDLKWKSASAQWGQVRVGKNAGGGAMKIAGKTVEGIGAHALSVIAYDLPAGYTRFKATAGIDNGGSDQGGNSTIQFYVFNKNPNLAKLSPKSAPKRSGAQAPADALAALDVADGLVASTFASEPMMLSPSSIDIDHRGRVWVCEVTNYRRHKNNREAGDRILILEDTNGDSVADSVKVFHQGRDVDSAHGVTVLGDKIIVSVGDKVIVFTDANGDDKPDGPAQPLFTGISGSQHDHGIHAFHFGPDGRLYFNFGNAGRQIKDKDGKPIIDMAGNEVNDRRKPYQQGMVFRCEMDGSNFETLGWNFRNNWEACVDSFGSVWQSDNDDDGNRGVRINYVMEYGNYGYRDEITGKGWRDKRSNMPKLPQQHWYQNSPGVVPNLIHTGAGSPTGIMVYEGELLPAGFRNQIIHCDAGPNICRAYPVTSAGAGYTAEMVDVLKGSRDRFYRPSDVCVAPDGSLLIADWYDPGVGGHNMQDLDNGRIYRVAPANHKYGTAKPDFSTADGAAAALKSPNMATRYLAWTALNKMQGAAKSALAKLAANSNPRYRARAFWLLAAIDGNLQATLDQAAADPDENIRGMAIRIARRHQIDSIPLVAKSAKDKSPVVRREAAIALRHSKSAKAPGIWAELAAKHVAGDRWYLEALGIGADKNEDAYFAAWLAKSGSWKADAGKDIVWRSRAKAAPGLLAKIVLDPATKAEMHPHYMRAFDFHKGPEKDAALQEILLAQ